jgi:hypothetical protein
LAGVIDATGTGVGFRFASIDAEQRQRADRQCAATEDLEGVMSKDAPRESRHGG